MAVGTLDFVAPEASIPGRQIDGRADLYAVGVRLYQMLTGNLPRGAFKPASVMVHGLDARFDQIVLKAMQVDREERHSSATELRQHLDTLLMPAVPAPNFQRCSSAQMPRSAGAPTRTPSSQPPRGAPKPAGDPAVAGRAPVQAAKSKTPLFIGITAALAVGAFVMMRGTSVTKAPGTAQGTVRTTLGLPLGNLTSQLWANFFLDPLDHWITEEMRFGAYARYTNDFRIFADDKAALHELRKGIEAYLAGLPEKNTGSKALPHCLSAPLRQIIGELAGAEALSVVESSLVNQFGLADKRFGTATGPLKGLEFA